MNRRTDRYTELYVEATINGLERTGYQTAARALHEQSVPIETALRVLTRPDERRRGISRHQAVFPDEDLTCPASGQVLLDVQD
jgi:hypothetical protein